MMDRNKTRDSESVIVVMPENIAFVRLRFNAINSLGPLPDNECQSSLKNFNENSR